MCPDCLRGLKIGTNELCAKCEGTGIWHPSTTKTISIEVPEEVAASTAPVEVPHKVEKVVKKKGK